jgi:eukaryotic-like serine/threonine-protein kinase
VDSVLGGRYALGAPLGCGGMAQVYAARDLQLERPVAVKILRSGLSDPRARERFAHEARMAAAFVHPHSVAVYDVGEEDQRPYLVMELVEGRDLQELLAADGPLPLGEALRIGDEILDALGAAHAEGLVHRDVKPGNVLIRQDGAVKLADFGIAKAAEATAELTPTDQVLGTPKYLSPEQTSGRRATARSDQYAAGVILYEMLAGDVPFAGATPVATALAHQRQPVPPLVGRAPNVPADVAAVVERALEKDPAARFPDEATMRRALERAGADAAPTEPIARTKVLPVPDVSTERLLVPAGRAEVPTRRRPARREPQSRPRALVAAGLVGAVVITTGIGLAMLRDSDPPTRPGGAGAADAAGLTDADATTPTAAVPPTTVEPRTISEILDLMRFSPSSFGPKGDELFDKLVRISAGEQVETAQLAAELDTWIENGEIDPELGAAVRQIVVLLGIAETTDDGSAGNNGNGNGDGNEDD